MARQRIEEWDDQGNVTRVSWFSREKATQFVEETYWDGHNNVSKATRDQWQHEALWRTASGFWVLNRWSDWQGSDEQWTVVSADFAREWLVRCEYSTEAIARALGEEPLPEEHFPGRTAAGVAFTMRMADELVDEVDQAAGLAGISRAAWLSAGAKVVLIGGPSLVAAVREGERVSDDQGVTYRVEEALRQVGQRKSVRFG